MGNKFIKFIFFSNYFVGLLSVALSIEMSLQAHLPFNSVAFYSLLFMTTVLYYTYAYVGPVNANSSVNPRTEWYRKNNRFVKTSQLIFLTASAILIVYLGINNLEAIFQLELVYWLLGVIIVMAALLYYGLLPKSFIRLNLRGTGWVKAFVIGFVWASCVNILPLIDIKIEKGALVADPVWVSWLFVKNFMFCTVNAIMFDIKDYADDSNRQLKTFVVRYGLHKTIFFILIPLLLVGVISLILFTMAQGINRVAILLNLLPFACLLFVAYSLQKEKRILYYLVIIDGLIFFKALCGIAGVLLTNI
jgi:4-hydroxybenzoate polyprenyltransferase